MTQDIINRLQNISLFYELKNNREALEKISKIIKIENFPKNTYIIKEGDIGTKMYILNKGEVRIEKTTLSKDTFTVINLKDDMDAYFGELALIDNDLRSASVVSLTDVECYVIDKKDFENICENNYQIGYYIYKEIAKKLSIRLRKITLDNINLISALISED